MKFLQVTNAGPMFKALLRSRNVQAAAMVLKPGQAFSDEKENEHPRAEQWLFVISGSGRAKLGSRTVRIRAGSLLLIEKDEPHQIISTGKTPLSTINFYCPPAYNDKGTLLPAAKR